MWYKVLCEHWWTNRKNKYLIFVWNLKTFDKKIFMENGKMLKKLKILI